MKKKVSYASLSLPYPESLRLPLYAVRHTRAPPVNSFPQSHCNPPPRAPTQTTQPHIHIPTYPHTHIHTYTHSLTQRHYNRYCLRPYQVRPLEPLQATATSFATTIRLKTSITFKRNCVLSACLSGCRSMHAYNAHLSSIACIDYDRGSQSDVQSLWAPVGCTLGT